MSTNASKPQTPSGLLNVAKPSGVTSRAVVDRVARLFRKVKVGHAGTLDPLASGVLVIALGPATRLIEYVQRQPKTYRTVVRLGRSPDPNPRGSRPRRRHAGGHVFAEAPSLLGAEARGQARV